MDPADYSLVSLFVDHWPEILLFDFLRYAIPASLLTALLALFSKRLLRRRIQVRRRTMRDLKRELARSGSTILIFSLVGVAIAAGEQHGFMLIVSGSENVLWQIGNLILIILLHDAYFYWAHRTMHHPSIFHRVHRTHHLSRTPSPWAAYSFAPLEAVIEALFLPIYLLFVPTHIVVIAIFLVHMILRNVIAHAGIELFPKTWMASPILRQVTVTTHHDMHHEHFHSNYGFYFTWWDRWMGTEHPEYQSRFEQLTKSPTRSEVDGVVRPHTSVLIVLLVLSATTMSDLQAETCDIEGLWVTEGFGAIVSIETTDDALLGSILWVYDQREQALVGQHLFSEFEGRACNWRKGLVLNPESGRRYRSTITVDESGNIALRGCLGPFCQTQRWYPYSRVFSRLPQPYSPTQS